MKGKYIIEQNNTRQTYVILNNFLSYTIFIRQYYFNILDLQLGKKIIL